MCDSCPICYVELGNIPGRIYTLACGAHAHCMACLTHQLAFARRQARELAEPAAQAAREHARVQRRSARDAARAAAAAGEAAARGVVNLAQRCSVCRVAWSMPERLAVAAALRMREILC